MSTPRVSIGVPVYNGQRYIRFTLDSLLAQTFTDIEVIVADNCSTDSTPQIVQEYAARDPRVRYCRNETNLGPARNYNRCVELARGEYFKWNPSDDVCAPEFVQRCVEALDADPTVMMAYPRTTVIDTEGKVILQYQYETDFAHPKPAVRFWRMICVNHKLHGAHEMYGVIRTDQMRKTGLMCSHVRGDSVLLSRMALQGRLKRIEEYLFFNRDHSDRSSKYLSRGTIRKGSRLSRYIGCGPLPSAEWWDPSLKGKIVFPEWRVLREYIRAVHDVDLPAGQRLACYGVLSMFTVRHLPKLARDLVIAGEQFVNGALGIADETHAFP